MFGLFRTKPLLDEVTTQWLFDSYAWALRNFGSDIFYEDTILVTPSNRHFPDKLDDVDEMAAKVFERVKQYAGLQHWACELVAQEPDVNPIVMPTVILRGAPRGPAGTFSVSKEEETMAKVVITYNPDQVGDPGPLVATFAHELAHYLSCAEAAEPPPGGEKYWEYATDLLAVFMGFGLFLANSAFSFSQYTGVQTQGWSAENRGYMSQYELTYALAIFCVLKGISNQEVERFLKRSLFSFYKKAIKEISNKPEIVGQLKSITKPLKGNQ